MHGSPLGSHILCPRIMSCISIYDVVPERRRDGPDESGRRERMGIACAREAEARIVALVRMDLPRGHARRAPRPVTEKGAGLGYVEPMSHVAVGNMPRKTSLCFGSIRTAQRRYSISNIYFFSYKKVLQ